VVTVDVLEDVVAQTRRLLACAGYPDIQVLVRKDGGALRGRMVLRTGFIPVRGPLHIEDQWAVGVRVTDPADVVREPDPGPRFSARPPDEPAHTRRDQVVERRLASP
jgi:hypothetical protein